MSSAVGSELLEVEHYMNKASKREWPHSPLEAWESATWMEPFLLSTAPGFLVNLYLGISLAAIKLGATPPQLFGLNPENVVSYILVAVVSPIICAALFSIGSIFDWLFKPWNAKRKIMREMKASFDIPAETLTPWDPELFYTKPQEDLWLKIEQELDAETFYAFKKLQPNFTGSISDLVKSAKALQN